MYIYTYKYICTHTHTHTHTYIAVRPTYALFFSSGDRVSQGTFKHIYDVGSIENSSR